MGIFSDLLGTLRDTFRIGKSTLSSSGLSVARTHSLPNASGQLVVDGNYHQLPQIAVAEGDTTPDPGASGVPAWSTTTRQVMHYDNGRWTALSRAGSYVVDYALDQQILDDIFTLAGSTLNFTHPRVAMATPVAGQKALFYNGTDAGSGIFVLGSVSNLAAVPVSRHPDWPAGRLVWPGTEIIALASTTGLAGRQLGFVTLTAAAVSPLDDTLKLPHLSRNTLVNVTLSGTGSMPAPLTVGGYYYVGGRWPGAEGLLHVLSGPYGTVVDLTSTGGNDPTSGTIGDVVGVSSLDTQLTSRLLFNTQYGPVDIADADLLSRTSLSTTERVDGPAGTDSQYALGWLAHSHGQAVAVGPSAVASRAGSVALGNASRAYNTNAVVFGTGTSRRAGEIATQGHAAVFPNDLGEAVEYGYGARRQFRLLYAALAGGGGEGALRCDGLDQLADTGVPLDPDTSWTTVQGTVTCVSKFSDKYAVWRVDGQVTVYAGVVSVRLTSKLVASQGATGAWKFRWLASFAGQKLDLLATSETDSCWSAWLELQAIGVSGAAPPAGDPVRSDNVVEVVASETLTAGQYVSFHSSSGSKVRKADAGNGYLACGHVLQNYVASDVALVYLSGENPFLSGLTVGPLYLGSAGGVSSTPGSTPQEIGFALSATRAITAIHDPGITVGTTAPASPTVGQLWVDTN